MRDYIKNHILKSISVKQELLQDETILKKIEQTVLLIKDAYLNNKKILIAGNGGSASDAQHITAELVGKFFKERQALNAIALSTNTSILTAIGNDYSNDYIFSRQIQAYGNEGDVYIAISTSGKSNNIIKSIIEAKKKGLKVIGLSGKKPSEMDKLCDLIIKIPSDNTPLIQESHIMIGHIICGLIEEMLF